MRAVNAVLTSLDNIKKYKNIMILCTSNMIDVIDSAFLDRLDLKLFLDNPIYQAR